MGNSIEKLTVVLVGHNLNCSPIDGIHLKIDDNRNHSTTYNFLFVYKIKTNMSDRHKTSHLTLLWPPGPHHHCSDQTARPIMGWWLLVAVI